MIREVMIIAKQSKLSKVHPLEKIVLVIGALLMSSYIKDSKFLLANIILFFLLHLISKNPIKMVMKFVTAVAVFYLFTAISLIFTGNSKEIVLLLERSVLGGVVISFLTLTTPVDDILREISKVNFLRDICDIAKAMERFIILIEDEAIMLNNSFKARGAFDGFKKSLKDFGKMVSVLFKNTLIKWKDIRQGLNARGYRGVTPYLSKEYKHNVFFIVGVMVYITVCVFSLCLLK